MAVHTELIRFFRWLDARPLARCQRLDTLTGADLNDYARHLPVVLAGKSVTRSRARAAVRRLWSWRTRLTDHLKFDPRSLEGWGESHSARRRENSTDRIPEAVLGPILAWALRFVTVFAPDILAARVQPRSTPTGVPEPGGAPRRKPRSQNVYRYLQALLDDHVRRGEPLPGWQGKPSKYQLAKLVDCSPKALNAYWDAVTDAAEIVGAKDAPPLACEIVGQLDGRPWTETITLGQPALCDVGRLARMLHTACFIVIAYLSGMRDSEIKHLRRGSLRIEYDAEGHPYRWKVSSLAFKGEDDIEGVPATWNVGEPVAQVITVLEQLQPEGTDLLFACLDAPDSNPHSEDQAVSNYVTNNHLNAFITWINRYCTQHSRLHSVPAVAGRSWHLKTSQFRRTLAWFIARHPGGSIAGAIQYRHLNVQMFEGYAGTSDSGFRAEVESEQVLARGEQLLAMIDAQKHTHLAGPAAVLGIGGRGHDAHFFRVHNIEKAGDPIPEGEFAVLLSHTPEIYRQAAHAGFDLLLAGHTHGGQVCLPGGVPITLDSNLPRRLGAERGPGKEWPDIPRSVSGRRSSR